MASEKHRKLVETLHRKTAAGKLDWREADLILESDVYQLDLAMNSLRISRSTNSDGDDLIVISLLNGEAKVVESFSDEDIEPDTNDRVYFRLLRDLYEMAGRRAMGSDKILDDILTELDDDIPF